MANGDCRDDLRAGQPALLVRENNAISAYINDLLRPAKYFLPSPKRVSWHGTMSLMILGRDHSKHEIVSPPPPQEIFLAKSRKRDLVCYNEQWY
jgi:hypothetical protein